MCSLAWLCALPLLALLAALEERGTRRDCRAPALRLPPAEGAEALRGVHVVYASDERNFGGLLASVASLAQHLREPQSCTVHVIVNGSSLARARALVGCLRRARPGAGALSVRLHELRPLPFDVRELSREHWHGRADLLNNELKYQKLYLHEYLPAAPRALWLDTDTIIRADVGRLYRMRMAHALAAAPESAGVADGLRLVLALNAPERLPRLAGLDDASFFNVGVLLLDLRRWRRELPRVEALLRSTAGLMVEQVALGLAFPAGQRDALDWRWNLLGLASAHRLSRWCVGQARVLHWTGGGFNGHKPWHEGAAGPQDYLFRPHRVDECP